MTLEEYINYCLAKPGVEVSYPFKGECAWLKVGGKMFTLVNVKSMKKEGKTIAPFHFANLKCDPEKALLLRETHGAIQAGWHQNKDHWNSVYMDGSLTDKLIKELIDHAYALVATKLSKKTKTTLGIL